MLNYLIERENEEMLRTSVRVLNFPDGETCRVSAYRLVWSWFDRIITSDFAPDEDKLLEMTQGWALQHTVSIDEAFGQLIECVVKTGEELGMDYTDDTLPLSIARQRLEQFQERKQKR